ncbi:hypothetical protein UFOVP116_351 [uncultured Caudovirales phage]|uniref:Uncharacterized protein n=1 Tax=uncultured Caudovirales phage TaxID=2100421 RepID=A0A6J5LAD3_9CAUD|nr:hypothetical protein UFOVP116_351 [uncultured Caudovirales phage]
MNLSDLFEMSNIRKKESGLPVNIFVSSGGSINQQHGPRIKVMVDASDRFNISDTVSVLLKQDITSADIVGYNTLPTNVLTQVREYINLNYSVLSDYWYDRISTKEMILALQPLQ